MSKENEIICRGSIRLGTGCGSCSRCHQEMERLYFENKTEPVKSFLNTSSYEFTDISSEEFRIYEFKDKEILLNNPLKLAVSESGHRVYTADGLSHYIPKGWLHITWRAKEGKPNFVK